MSLITASPIKARTPIHIAGIWRLSRCIGTQVRLYPYTALVLAVGLIVRAVLVPIAHGEDFTVWDLASRYTLAGVNIYAHHPPYPGGPYAYTPLFLYVELPPRWLALHTGISFTILGKLPIAAGDILTAGLIAAVLARRGRRDTIVALGTALYFLNPLVLYNGAFYGRFDTLCAGLLLLALVVHDRGGIAGTPASAGQPIAIPNTSVSSATDAGWRAALTVATNRQVTRARRGVLHTPTRSDRVRQVRQGGTLDAPARDAGRMQYAPTPSPTLSRVYRARQRPTTPSRRRSAPANSKAPGRDSALASTRLWLFPLLYAAAVAMKSYPIFLLPWLLAREPSKRKRLLLALAGVCGGLSLPYLLTSPARFFADVALYDTHKTPGHLSWQVLALGILSPHAARLVSYLLLAIFVAALYLCRTLDLWTYAVVSILLFMLLSKVVIEQYFLWPLPFLILDACGRRSWSSGLLLALLSAVGMLVNPYIHPFGESPWLVNVMVAISIALYVYRRIRYARSRGSGPEGPWQSTDRKRSA